ncbi:MAG TPA: response regulator [Ruminiclostridium sp.]
MIRVVVVDDEPPILNTVAKMIEQSNENFEIVGKALNGEDALQLILSLKPDVVFTDIKMPVMDGLALIENLNTLDPIPVSVILSGYAEFEYARKALQYGIFDYLMKPINLDILENLLNKIYENLYQKKMSSEIKFLGKISRHPVVTNQDQFHLQKSDMFTFDKYICFLFCVGSYCSYHSSLFTPGQEFFAKNNLEALFAKSIKQPFSFRIIDGEHENERIVLIGSNHNSENELNSKSETVYALLTSQGIPITAMVSMNFDNIMQLGTQVQKLRNALKKDICFGVSQFITKIELESTKTRKDGDILNSSWENLFSTAIAKMQCEIFKQNLKSLLNICENRHCRQYILEKVLQQIFSLFCCKPEYNLSDRLVDIHMELNEIITCATSYQLLYESLSYLTDDLFNSCKSVGPNPNTQDEIIDKMDEYIRLNYFKPINLQTLSDLFGFAPQYLGRKYKKAKGTTPNDLIIQLRISKSKELLKIKPALSIQDIANSVGYEDPFYLSRVFKLVTGKSPSEFRNL